MSYIPYSKHFVLSRTPYSNDLFHFSDPSYNTGEDTDLNDLLEYQLSIVPKSTSVDFNIIEFNDFQNNLYNYDIVVMASSGTSVTFANFSSANVGTTGTITGLTPETTYVLKSTITNTATGQVVEKQSSSFTTLALRGVDISVIQGFLPGHVSDLNVIVKLTNFSNIRVNDYIGCKIFDSTGTTELTESSNYHIFTSVPNSTDIIYLTVPFLDSQGEYALSENTDYVIRVMVDDDVENGYPHTDITQVGSDFTFTHVFDTITQTINVASSDETSLTFNFSEPTFSDNNRVVTDYSYRFNLYDTVDNSSSIITTLSSPFGNVTISNLEPATLYNVFLTYFDTKLETLLGDTNVLNDTSEIQKNKLIVIPSTSTDTPVLSSVLNFNLTTSNVETNSVDFTIDQFNLTDFNDFYENDNTILIEPVEQSTTSPPAQVERLFPPIPVENATGTYTTDRGIVAYIVEPNDGSLEFPFAYATDSLYQGTNTHTITVNGTSYGTGTYTIETNNQKDLRYQSSLAFDRDAMSFIDVYGGGSGFNITLPMSIQLTRFVIYLRGTHSTHFDKAPLNLQLFGKSSTDSSVNDELFNITITEGDYTLRSQGEYLNKVDPTEADYSDIPAYEISVSNTNYYNKFQFIGSRSDQATYYATEMLIYGYQQAV